MTLNLALTLLVLCILFNAVVFSIYWIDKRAARNGRWRVSETTPLLLAFAGGSLGAVAAQRVVRHKTHKEPFRTILAAIVTLHVCLAVVLILAVSGRLASIWTLIEEVTALSGFEPFFTTHEDINERYSAFLSERPK